jgi:hypothetical protein
MWNGVNYVESNWDGLVVTAIDRAKEKMGRWESGFREVVMPKDNWLVVTVDYHS